MYVLHFLSFLLAPAPLFRRARLWLGCALCTFFLTTGYSISNEGCEYPNVFSPTFTPPKNRIGEFRISLEPPDYQNAKSVQDHLAFSTTWAELLISRLANQTNGRCSANISVSLFPDLRVVLSETPSPSTLGNAPSHCIEALTEILRNATPDNNSIKQAALLEARGLMRRISNPASDLMSASNILTAALNRIYDAGTVMHALVSIEPGTFQSFDVISFITWLKRQRLARRLELDPLRFCGRDVDPGSPIETGAQRLPYSSTIASSPLVLPIRIGGPLFSGQLRYAVIVGEGAAVNFSRATAPAIEKYCDQERTIAWDMDSVPHAIKAVRIRCLRSVRFNDAWTVFYCDPKDCTSEQQAEVAMREIENDSDVILLAKGGGTNMVARGPYVIAIKVTAE